MGERMTRALPSVYVRGGRVVAKRDALRPNVIRLYARQNNDPVSSMLHVTSTQYRPRPTVMHPAQQLARIGMDFWWAVGALTVAAIAAGFMGGMYVVEVMR